MDHTVWWKWSWNFKFDKFDLYFIYRLISIVKNLWDKGFKNRSSKICGRQPVKHLKGHGLLKQIYKSLLYFSRYLLIYVSRFWVSYTFVKQIQVNVLTICWSLFFIKLHAFQPPAILSKRDSNTAVMFSLWDYKILWNLKIFANMCSFSKTF